MPDSYLRLRMQQRTLVAETGDSPGPSRSTARIGYRSAQLATLFSLWYVVAQLAEWMGWLGSAGGPESASTPLGLTLLLTPSLLLAPAFLVLMVSLHQTASADRRVWSHPDMDLLARQHPPGPAVPPAPRSVSLAGAAPVETAESSRDRALKDCIDIPHRNGIL